MSYSSKPHLMTLQIFFTISPYLLSAVISAGISVFSFKRASKPGAIAFGFLSLFETVWTVGYVLQTISPSLSDKIFWNNVQFLGAVASPVAFFIFCFTFTRQTIGIYPLIWRSLAFIASALLLLIWTDGYHSLFRGAVGIEPGAPFSTLVFSDGPLFVLYPIIAYPLLILGAYTVMVNYLTSPRVYRLQIATVMVGILIPWIATLVTWLKLVNVNLHDLTPLTFGISNLVVAWALFRFGLFDLIPVAYNTLVDQMKDGVIVLDHDWRILDMNAASQEILNINLVQALGKQIPTEHPLAHILFECTGKSTYPSKVAFTVDDDERYYEMHVTMLLDNRKAVYGRLVLLHDITDWKRAEKKLEIMALTDPLTGIYNRRHFFELAENEYTRSIRTGSAMSMILIDIDHFKIVNDSLGHLAGDRVLQDLTARCQGVLRQYDIIARYGGEEFIILLPETGKEAAEQIGERLRERIASEPFLTADGQAVVTISLGISSHQSVGSESLNSLVNCADLALYQAKQKGRNQACTWINPLIELPVKSHSN
jgi:diguanylate cyclase (GGDEF)-like protein